MALGLGAGSLRPAWSRATCTASARAIRRRSWTRIDPSPRCGRSEYQRRVGAPPHPWQSGHFWIYM